MNKYFSQLIIIVLFFHSGAYSALNNNCKKFFSEIKNNTNKGVLINYNKKSENNFSQPGYFVLLRSFGKGDIGSVYNSLEDLKKMGIKQIWISPLEPQTIYTFVNKDSSLTKNDHGYWPSVHGKIDKKLGGEIAFKRLVKRANELGMEIMVDSVLDHFGYGKKFNIAGRQIEYGDSNYFRNPGDEFNDVPQELNLAIENSTDPTGIRELFRVLTQYEMFSLPGLNHENPKVQKYLVDSYKKYIDMGVRSFRIDGAKHIPVKFLKNFISELSNHDSQKLTFLVEGLFNKYPVLDVYIKDIIDGIDSKKADVSFIDFPLANELRQIYYRPDYKFGYLWNYIKYRENGKHHLKNLVPMLEDHDLLEPINDPFFKKTINVLGEYLSMNSSIIYQGTESSEAIKHNSREHVKAVNPEGDAVKIIKNMSKTMRSYRNGEKNFKTTERWIEDDFVVLEREDGRGNFLYICINKSNNNISRSVDTHKNLSDKKITTRISELGNSIKVRALKEGKIEIDSPPRSFIVFEVSGK